MMLGAILGAKLACREEILVPVPLHAHRLAERGFNQAEAIAKGIAEATGAVVTTRALDRTRQTQDQRSLPLARRENNVCDAFALAPEGAALSGAHVLLVDDVVTTGATIAACARALRHAGITHVRAIAIAIKV